MYSIIMWALKVGTLEGKAKVSASKISITPLSFGAP